MKNFKVFFAALMLLVLAASCERVEPNYSGVLMENYGKNGKSDYSLQMGSVWTSSPGTTLFTVPMYEQRCDFVSDQNADGVLHLKAADNTEFTAKPMYTFAIIKGREVDVVFNNARLDNDEFITELANQVLEPMFYDLLKEESRKYPTDSLMTSGGNLKFENTFQKLLKVAFEERGIELKSISTNLDFSDKVKAKIDTRNEVSSNITVLDQQILEQKKRNELAALKAEELIILSRGYTQAYLRDKALNVWQETKVPIYSADMANYMFSIK